MQRKNRSAGSSVTAILLALVLIIFVVSTVYVFWAKTWFGLNIGFPPAITATGQEIDSQFQRTLIITGIVFILSQLGLAWAVFRFRDRGGARAAYTEGNQVMEVLWTMATLILFVGLGLFAEKAWAENHFRDAAPGALQIEVTGVQFAWSFRYPGPDGKFGRLDPTLVNGQSNPLGQDRNDPNGKDDIVSPVMAVPVGREVELLLRSQDVTHSFFVRELRLKQDAVPGMLIHIHFKAEEVTPADKPLEILCAELCGLGHYKMHSFMSVLSEADYEKWLKDQAAMNQ